MEANTTTPMSTTEVTDEGIPPAIRAKVAQEILDELKARVKANATPDYSDFRWRDQHWAAAHYIKVFGRIPTPQQVERITSTVKNSRLWDQAMAQHDDPADVDGLIGRYAQLQRAGKLTIDAKRLTCLNRTLAALPDVEQTVRMLEECQTNEGHHAITDAKRLMLLISLHNHAAWHGAAGPALDAAWLLFFYDERPMQTLAGLLLCQTLRQYPAIMTDALANLQQALLL